MKSNRRYEIVLSMIVLLLCFSIHTSLIFLPIGIWWKIGAIFAIDTLAYIAHQLDTFIGHK